MVRRYKVVGIEEIDALNERARSLAAAATAAGADDDDAARKALAAALAEAGFEPLLAEGPCAVWRRTGRRHDEVVNLWVDAPGAPDIGEGGLGFDGQVGWADLPG